MQEDTLREMIRLTGLLRSRIPPVPEAVLIFANSGCRQLTPMPPISDVLNDFIHELIILLEEQAGRGDRRPRRQPNRDAVLIKILAWVACVLRNTPGEEFTGLLRREMLAFPPSVWISLVNPEVIAMVADVFVQANDDSGIAAALAALGESPVAGLPPAVDITRKVLGKRMVVSLTPPIKDGSMVYHVRHGFVSNLSKLRVHLFAFNT